MVEINTIERQEQPIARPEVSVIESLNYSQRSGEK